MHLQAATLLSIMSNYLEHVAVTPHTLLPRFYGLIVLGGIFFTVSENFFWSGAHLVRRFDLKGSTYKRAASARERAKGEAAILKDNDWVRMRAAQRSRREDGEACADGSERVYAPSTSPV